MKSGNGSRSGWYERVGIGRAAPPANTPIMHVDSQASPVDDLAPAPLPSGRLPWNVRLLGLASLLNDIAGEMIFPLIPLFLLTVRGAGASALGAVEGVADTTASIVKLWSGSLSDRAG